MAEIIQTRTANNIRLPRKLSVPQITVAVSFILCIFLFSFFGNFKNIFNADNYLDYRAGDVVKEDVYSDSDFYLIDKSATENKKKLAETLAFPVFKIYNDITREVVMNYDLFLSEIKMYRENGFPDSGHMVFTNGFEETFDSGYLIDFLEDENFISSAELTSNILQNLMNRGVLYSGGLAIIPSSGIIEVWRETGDDFDRTIVKYNQMPRVDNISLYIENELSSGNYTDQTVKTVEALVAFNIRENCFPDEFQTQLNRDLSVSKVKPVEIYLAKGDLILEKGFIVTPEMESKLQTMKEVKGKGGILSFIAPVIFTTFLFAFAIIYFKSFSPDKKFRGLVEIAVFSALTLIVLTSYIIVLFTNLPSGLPAVIFVPVALFSMLITLLTDKRSGLIYQLIASMALYYLSGYKIEFLLLTSVSGITGCVIIEGVARRIDMIRAGLIQGLTQAALFALYELMFGLDGYGMIWGSSIMFFNGFASGILALGLLPVLEHWLRTSTRFRLIELSDTNANVLKNMLAKAPGTYIHSMNVANLAEMACQGIGANTLLARVGGLYHDIGKVDQSEYFIENQTDVNKHDDMKPSLSAAVLKAHVKIGIEKGHDLNLPTDVIDIIAQHHATSTMKYFYDRAMKEKGNTKINRDDFSYSGPNPQTREAAIVMLADTIEAATRTLKKPSLAKLEKYVWELIMDKFINGELNECDLTFRDMELVKTSFVHVLAGHFHTRIEYPEEQKNREKEAEVSEQL